jgi:hypothetical protein
MAKKKPEDLDGVSETLERFDPDLDVESDSDPMYEAKLAEEPDDKHVMLVHKDDVGRFRGKRYEPMKGGDATLECGASFPEGETMTFREHVYMWRDRAYHERREKVERKQNKDLRTRMIKKSNNTIFVNNPGASRNS